MRISKKQFSPVSKRRRYQSQVPFLVGGTSDNVTISSCACPWVRCTFIKDKLDPWAKLRWIVTSSFGLLRLIGKAFCSSSRASWLCACSWTTSCSLWLTFSKPVGTSSKDIDKHQRIWSLCISDTHKNSPRDWRRAERCVLWESRHTVLFCRQKRLTERPH